MRVYDLTQNFLLIRKTDVGEICLKLAIIPFPNKNHTQNVFHESNIKLFRISDIIV